MSEPRRPRAALDRLFRANLTRSCSAVAGLGLMLGGIAVGSATASASGGSSSVVAQPSTSQAPPPPGMTSVPLFVAGPPPGAVHLLDAVASDEGQLIALAAINEARSLQAQAVSLEDKAQRQVDKATVSWEAARQREVQAVRRQAHYERRVAFYRQALGQLALAEYTGGASTPNGDMASQESELEQATMANVAAGDASNALKRAEASLAKAKAQVAVCRSVVHRTAGILAKARVVLGSARQQLALSRRDVGLAHKWATQTGTSPLYPAEALLNYEGPLGREVIREQKEQAKRAHRDTSASLPQTEASVPATTLPAGSPSQLDDPSVNVATTSVPIAEFGGKQLPAYDGPAILGPSLLSQAEILGWYESTATTPHITTSINQLVWDYMKAGRITGVRADLAFSQSIVETGHFIFPAGGQLTGKDNNFAGIGACDSCKHGWKFPSAMAGVLAQEELLEAYATPPSANADGSSMAGGVQGCCTTWLALSGVWATNPYYGYEILGIYKEMLDWAIPRQLFADGLISQPRFEQEELLLPEEDARTYALVADAIAGSTPKSGPSCPSATTSVTAGSGHPTAMTTSTSTTTSVPTTTSSTGTAGAGSTSAPSGSSSCLPASDGPVPSSTTATTSASR